MPRPIITCISCQDEKPLCALGRCKNCYARAYHARRRRTDPVFVRRARARYVAWRARRIAADPNYLPRLAAAARAKRAAAKAAAVAQPTDTQISLPRAAEAV